MKEIISKLVLFFLSIKIGLFSFSFDNIPLFNPEAPHVIPFIIPKDFSDGSLKSSFLKDLKSFFGADVFVESGTYLGNTTAKAAELFQEVHSIEIFPKFYSEAAERFEEVPNISLHLGDSGTVLSQILPRIHSKILFYLDGHFDGDSSGKGILNTPILEELRAIRQYGHPDSLLLIDDLSDFQESLFPLKIANSCFEGYPKLEQLIEEILNINPSYKICFLGNALLAFPPIDKVTVSKVVSACAIDRLSTAVDFLSEDLLLDAEKRIAQAPEPEKSELVRYALAYSSFEWKWGWRSFGAFWRGLILQENGRRFAALSLFRKTASHSLPGWRIDRYNSTVERIQKQFNPSPQPKSVSPSPVVAVIPTSDGEIRNTDAIFFLIPTSFSSK